MELKNAVHIFSQLSSAALLQFYGFDEKKIDTHVQYCKHLLDAAKVHCEAAEREEHQNRQKLEVQRQVTLAEEARRKAEEQRKFQLERRKQEDELKRVMQQEQHFERIKEQWKITNTSTSKRKERTMAEDEDGGYGERKKRRGGKKKRKDKKHRAQYEEGDMNEEQEDRNLADDQEDEGAVDAQDHLLAAGLEDSDAEDDDMAAKSPVRNRRRQAWSESEDDDLNPQRREDGRENSTEVPGSDGEIMGNKEKYERSHKANIYNDDEEEE